MLVAVLSPTEYRCVVLPTVTAETAAQIDLDRSFRKPKRDGGLRKPGKMWVDLDPSPEKRRRDPLLGQESELLKEHINKWSILD